MSLSRDGSYIIQTTYFLPKDINDGKKITGKIDDMSRMDKLKEFLDSNLTKAIKSTLMDASYTIEYNNGDKVVKVNDKNLWDQVVRLLPEFKEN